MQCRGSGRCLAAQGRAGSGAAAVAALLATLACVRPAIAGELPTVLVMGPLTSAKSLPTAEFQAKWHLSFAKSEACRGLRVKAVDTSADADAWMCESEPKCFAAIGKKRHAALAAVAMVDGAAGKYAFTARLIDVKTATVLRFELAAAQDTVKLLERITHVADVLCSSVTGAKQGGDELAIELPPGPAPKAEPAKTTTPAVATAALAPEPAPAPMTTAPIAKEAAEIVKAPAKKELVLVLPSKAEDGISESTVRLLGEIIVGEVSASGKYKVSTFDDVGDVLTADAKKQAFGCTDDSCATELGGSLGADLLISSRMGRVGTANVISLKLLSPKNASVVRRATETVTGGDDVLLPAVKRAVATLLAIDAATQPPVAANDGGGMAVTGAFAAAGVLAVVGGALGALSYSAAQSGYAAGDAPAFRDHWASAGSYALGANVSFGLAATSALVAGVLWLAGN